MSARPRGFIDGWAPRAETRALLDVIKRVLTDYAEQLPLTVRQIFYILVGRYLYEKTERAYDRLGELLNRARRARLVDMDTIRDDGFTSRVPNYFDTIDDFPVTIAHTARVLRFDRQRGQKRRLVLWCEAAGMVPQLARIADPYGVEVYSSGGFDSLTDKHRIAKLWAGAPITFQHIGDHDASGVHCFSSLAEDIAAFTREYGGDVEFVRLAVTLEQTRQYGLQSAPPKPTDRRRFEGNETYQAEALDPRDLADIVRSAVEAQLDRALYEAVLLEEHEARQAVLSRLGLDPAGDRP
jgi:hypothetical protein